MAAYNIFSCDGGGSDGTTCVATSTCAAVLLFLRWRLPFYGYGGEGRKKVTTDVMSCDSGGWEENYSPVAIWWRFARYVREQAWRLTLAGA